MYTIVTIKKMKKKKKNNTLKYSNNNKKQRRRRRLIVDKLVSHSRWSAQRSLTLRDISPSPILVILIARASRFIIEPTMLPRSVTGEFAVSVRLDRIGPAQHNLKLKINH